MGRVGRKIVRKVASIGRKFNNARGKIGRKIAKAGRIGGRIAPFLSAVPMIGPELAGGAMALSGAARAVGAGLQAHNVREASSAGRSLAETYAAHKASR